MSFVKVSQTKHDMNQKKKNFKIGWNKNKMMDLAALIRKPT